DRPQGVVDRPEQRKDPDRNHREQERVQDDPARADAARTCEHGHHLVLMTRDRKITMGTSEMRSRMTAIADPNPTRLASLMLMLVELVLCRTLLMKPSVGLNCSSQMKPTMTSDSTTGRKNTLW